MADPNVLVLAAGQGTRMRSQLPKGLHEICGVAMFLWPVRAALAAGAGRVVVVDSPGRALEPYLPEGVELAVQPVPDGTGGAALAGLAALDGGGRGPVVVLAGDVPLISPETISELLRAHVDAAASATMGSVVLADPAGYGRVVRDAEGEVQRVVETKAPGDATQAEREIDEVNTGIFVFEEAALREALPLLSTANAQGERYLPQALDVIRRRGGRVIAQVLSDERVVLGVNDRAALAAVRAIAQAAIHERHMLAGVTIVDPGSTAIDADVEIGADTVVEPFTTIRGSSRIGSGCAVRCSYMVD